MTPNVPTTLPAAAADTRALPTPHALRAVLETEHMQPAAESLLWLYNYSKANRLESRQIGELIGLAPESVRVLFSGKYPAKLEKIIDRIQRLRHAESQKGAPFVMTPTAKKIFGVCKFAASHNNVAFVYGESQTGKTFALQRYQIENNHGSTVYLRCPSFGGVDNLLSDLCETLHLNSGESITRRRSRILRTITSRQLLIIDEFHELFLGRTQNCTISCCEFIREVHDRTGCGLVICGTNAIPRQLDKGDLSAVLQQLARRGITRLALPDQIGEEDILAIAAHYALEDPDAASRAIIDQLLHDRGISAYVKFLDAARANALNKSTDLTWEHFRRAVKSFTAISAR